MICDRCKAKIEDLGEYHIKWHWDRKEEDGAFCTKTTSHDIETFFCEGCVNAVDYEMSGHQK